MRLIARSLAGLLVLFCLPGCKYKPGPSGGYAREGLWTPAMSGVVGTDGAGSPAESLNRMKVWRAQVSLEVWNVSNALQQAIGIVEKQGGFVERRSDSGAGYAQITLRIPAKDLKSAITSIEVLGTVLSSSLEGEDVTEEYIDVEARLQNKVLLRDRLKQLLEKAADVKDIVAIETELSRVQGEIDSMEGRIKALKGQVDMATLNLGLTRKQVLGPLGYAFNGLWWGVKKLFVLRE